MQLYNLKDKEQKVSFTQAVIEGIGTNQGLFFPENFERLDNIKELLELDFKNRSYQILKHLIGNEIDTLKDIVFDAFNFPCNIKNVHDNIYALELYSGPSLAFKDFGARFMARVLAKVNNSKRLTILTATSGDTGAAVADAFYKQEGIEVVILYPKNKISKLQEKLISTLGGNIHAIEIEGSFDDCQDIVKQAFDDRAFVNKVGLNSANSINVARLFAQVCYYFQAYSQINTNNDELIDIAVPCGNFGNICAGFIAKALGLNINLIIGSNVNDTVPRYLQSNHWEPKNTISTLSNAMDISRPNNWPRVEYLCNKYHWDKANIKYSVFSDDATCKIMQKVYKNNNYILEPHAAIAYQALVDNMKADVGIFLETAHPAKFKDDVDKILNINMPLPEAIVKVIDKQNLSVTMPKDFKAVKSYILNDFKL